MPGMPLVNASIINNNHIINIHCIIHTCVYWCSVHIGTYVNTRVHTSFQYCSLICHPLNYIEVFCYQNEFQCFETDYFPNEQGKNLV